MTRMIWGGDSSWRPAERLLSSGIVRPLSGCQAEALAARERAEQQAWQRTMHSIGSWFAGRCVKGATDGVVLLRLYTSTAPGVPTFTNSATAASASGFSMTPDWVLIATFR